MWLYIPAYLNVSGAVDCLSPVLYWPLEVDRLSAVCGRFWKCQYFSDINLVINSLAANDSIFVFLGSRLTLRASQRENALMANGGKTEFVCSFFYYYYFNFSSFMPRKTHWLINCAERFCARIGEFMTQELSLKIRKSVSWLEGNGLFFVQQENIYLIILFFLRWCTLGSKKSRKKQV